MFSQSVIPVSDVTRMDLIPRGTLASPMTTICGGITSYPENFSVDGGTDFESDRLIVRYYTRITNR